MDANIQTPPIDGVPDRDEAPHVQRLSLDTGWNRCGDVFACTTCDADGDYIEYDEHEAALGFERERSDALEALVRRQAEEIAVLRSLRHFAIPVPASEKETVPCAL